MRSFLISATAVAFLAVTSSASQAEVKQVSYPLVRVKLATAFSPDDTFVKMQTAFAAAVSAKDAQALFSLVGPTFLWMSRGELNDQFDFGSAPLDNFKALFGFSQSGKTPAVRPQRVRCGMFWQLSPPIRHSTSLPARWSVDLQAPFSPMRMTSTAQKER